MAEGAKSPVAASGEEQGRGGTVRPRSKSPTQRPTSPSRQHRSPRGSSSYTKDAFTTSLRAPPQAAQSNSVPATPYVHARRYSNDHRTPSPINGVKHDGNTSPRSVRSDSDSRVRPSGRTLFPQQGCNFETGMAYSRRRIPYSVGQDPLEKAASPIKASLSKEEGRQLTQDMEQLYERLLPTHESEERRAKFKQKLERILNEQWPGNDIKVHVFGSSGNMLCTTESDVDICITAPSNTIGKVCNLAQCLHNQGMQRVVCIPQAKVPIVKIWDPEYSLACDMNVNNAGAIENTRMIRTYVQIDPRVRPLAMIVKHWTRKRILNDAGMGGTLSSYTWISLLIHFLQSRDPPVLPALQQRPHQCTPRDDGTKSAFADDLAALSTFGDANKSSLGELLFGFFRYYGHEFDYENSVVSIREGKLLDKTQKGWQTMVNNRLCVEEPFNTDRNLANTADDYAFRGVHLEIRRAYDLLCEARLDACCELYEWPPVEAPFWQKPAPQPLPVLSRSRSQTNRSSRSSESSGRNPNQKRHRQNGVSGRRASSAAASNKNNPLLNQQNGQVWQGNDRNNPMSIHETLSHQMHLLQQQEAFYKLQQQQIALAHSHAQTVAQLPNMPGSASPRHVQSLSMREARRSSQIEPGPLSAPLRSLQSLQNAYFPTAGSNTPRSGSATPGMASVRSNATNPSSPSLAGRLAPVDSRHANQRPLTPEAADMSRSRSQPPSSQRTNTGQHPQMHDKFGSALAGFPGLQHYQQHYLQAKRHNSKPSSNTPVASPRLDSFHLDGGHSEDHLPAAEYAGYYIDNYGRQQPAHMMVQPSGYEQQERLWSPEMQRLKSESSRSPSPSAGTFRDRSYSVQSARSVQPTQLENTRAFGSLPTSLSTPGAGGPIIIDGSGDSPEANNNSRPSSLTESTSNERTTLTDERSIEEISPAVDPFIAVEDYTNSIDDDVAVPAASMTARNTVQFGEHEPRRLPSFAEHSSALQRQGGMHRATSQSSQTSAGWYDPSATNGLGIDVDPALTIKDLPLQGGQPTSQGSYHQQLHPHIASGIPKSSLSSLKPAPLLSPVREVRTPSPTTSRTNSSHASTSQARALHGRAVSLLSGQAAMQLHNKQQAAQEAARNPSVSPASVNASPRLTSQPFAAVVAAQYGNGQAPNSRVPSISASSRTTMPKTDSTDFQGPETLNGSHAMDAGPSKPRQGSAPSSVIGASQDDASQDQPGQFSEQTGWQQATKRGKKKHKPKNHSISIPAGGNVNDDRKGG